MITGFSLFSITTLLTSISSLFLGVFVIYRDIKSKQNFLWGMVSLSATIWSFGLYQIINSNSEAEAIFWNKILYLGAIFIPIFYYHFICSFLNSEKKDRIKIVLFYFVSLVFLYFNFTSSEFIKGAPSFGVFNYWLSVGYIYYFYVAFFVLLVCLSFLKVLRNYDDLAGNKKNQIRYIMIAGVIGFLGGATNFLPQILGIYPLGNYFVSLYVAIVTYAIVRYRLMGIRVIASKLFLYFFVAGFFYFFFYLIVFIENNYLGGVYSRSSLILGILFAIAFSVIFLPFVNYIQKSGDILFFRGYNPQKIIKDLSIELNSVIDLKKLLNIIVGEFKKILETDNVSILVFENSDKSKAISKNYSLNGIRLKNAVDLTKLQEILIIERNREEKFSSLVSELDKNEIEIVAPLVSHKEPIGAILLGEKVSRGGYTREDIEFLEIIGSQAAIAIENALLYKRVENFNRELRKKVDEQTADLREKAEHLKKLLKMRSEFLDTASHQLRTPVSVIRGAADMLGSGGNDPEKQKFYLEGIRVKSEKLNEIVNDLLTASEVDSEKYNVNFSEIDFNVFLKSLVEERRIQAEERKIAVEFVPPKEKLPPIKGDKTYLSDAVGNIIDNAIKYTQKGWVKMEAKIS